MSLADFEIGENFLPNIDVASFLNDPVPEEEYHLDDKAVELLKMTFDSTESSPLVGMPSDTSDEEHLLGSSPLSFESLEEKPDVMDLTFDAANWDQLFSTIGEPSSLEEDSQKKNAKKDVEKKPTKKRSRNASSTATSLADFKEATKDELLRMNSKEIETYMQKISSVKHLTVAQDKELKKIRRLIKNREYAASSRMKKKNYVDDVEKQLNDAKSETKGLRDRVQSLEIENKTLKYQLAQIGAAMKKDPELLERLKQATSSPSPSESPAPPSKKLKATVLPTLFILLFSFAFFFNFFSTSSSSPFNNLAGQRACPSNRCFLGKGFEQESFGVVSHWFQNLIAWGNQYQTFLSSSNGNSSNSEDLNPLIEGSLEWWLS